MGIGYVGQIYVSTATLYSYENTGHAITSDITSLHNIIAILYFVVSYTVRKQKF